MSDIHNGKYHFFWSGPFSQWARSDFVIEGVKYNTAEQYMMAEKARLFGDEDIAARIMNSIYPQKQKSLGRQVKGFNVEVWEQNAKLIVYRGSFAKFSQSVELLDVLFGTEDQILVEASPLDKVWGIGLDEADAAKTPVEQWQGRNWLGEVLTKVKADLRVIF